MRHRIYNCLIVLAAIFSLLTAQILPAAAQTAPVHVWTPLPVPVHQHMWQQPLPVPVHQHMWQQPLPVPVHQHMWQQPLVNLQSGGSAGSHMWFNVAMGAGGSTPSINLDLSATGAAMTAGHLLHDTTVTINIGGTPLAVNSKTELTPAEYLAVMQVVSGGQQSLVLDAEGSASGGTLVIGQHLSQMISSLVIPQGVSVTDISRSGILNLGGDLNDDGSLNLIANHSVSDNFSILAGNITIGSQGLLSTSGNLNLFAHSGSITNDGIISSANGSINISAPKNTDINVNSNNGIFTAENGNINFRDAGYAGANNINLNGGNYLSQNLNFYSGAGAVTANVNQVTGTVNSSAGSEHLIANTDNLVLGNNNINGDPTYANTGSIIIDGTLAPTEAIAIIAGGNIVANATGAISAAGTAVTLIAGADITGGGTDGQVITNTTPGVSGTVTIQFDNNFGGNIDFTASNASTAISSAGGNVVLLANSNSTTSGNIWFPTATTAINTANNAGTGGTVQIIAGGNGGTAQSGLISQSIQLGSIVTAATPQAGNTVSIIGATPVITGVIASFDIHGVTVAVFSSGAVNGSINLGSINTKGTGGAASVSVTAGGTITIGGNITAGSIQFTAKSNITGSSLLQSPTLNLTSTAGSIGTSSQSIAVSNGGNGISSLYASATAGSVYLSDTAHENVILSNQSTNGVSKAGSVFSLSAYGNIYGAPNTTDTGLVIQAPTVMLSSSNGNIAGDSANTFDTLQISGGGNGVILYATAPSGSVAISDAATENITLSTADTLGASVTATDFDLNSGGNIYSSDTSLAIQSPVVVLVSGDNIAANSSNAPLLISGGGSGTMLEIYNSSGSVYLSDTTHEDVTIATTNQAGFPLTVGTIFSLNAYGNIYASDNSQAIQAPEISLVSNNGNIGTGSQSIAISNGGNGIASLSASATAGSVYLQDTAGESVTLDTSSAASEFSLAASGRLTVAQTLTDSGTASRIDLSSSGTITVNSTIEATSTAGTGGLIQFTSLTGTGSVTVVNTGTIEASNTGTSIVGFNGGASGLVNVTNTTGTIEATDVNFGNLTSSLQMQSSYIVVGTYSSGSPFTGTYSSGNVTISDPIIGTIQVTGSATPPAPSPSASATASAASHYVAVQQQGLANQQAIVNQQIGTRIATDYTPILSPRASEYMTSRFPGPWWHTDTIPRTSPPLQGHVANEELNKTGQGLFAASSFNADELTALSNQGIVFGPGSNGNFFDLMKGYVLFMPTSDINVQTREGVVSIPRGAIAWIMETGNDAAIYDLHDSFHTGPIEVTVNKKVLTLSPGTQVLLTRNSIADFGLLNPGNDIGYRNVKASDLGEGIKAYVCDFSILHGLANVPVIHNLLISNDPAQRKSAWKLIKNATILTDLTGDGYKTGQ